MKRTMGQFVPPGMLLLGIQGTLVRDNYLLVTGAKLRDNIFKKRKEV